MSQKIFIALCLFDVIQSIVHLLPSIVYRWPLFVSLLVHAISSFKQVFTNLAAQKMFLSYPFVFLFCKISIKPSFLWHSRDCVIIWISLTFLRSGALHWLSDWPKNFLQSEALIRAHWLPDPAKTSCDQELLWELIDSLIDQQTPCDQELLLELIVTPIDKHWISDWLANFLRSGALIRAHSVSDKALSPRSTNIESLIDQQTFCNQELLSELIQSLIKQCMSCDRKLLSELIDSPINQKLLAIRSPYESSLTPWSTNKLVVIEGSYQSLLTPRLIRISLRLRARIRAQWLKNSSTTFLRSGAFTRAHWLFEEVTGEVTDTQIDSQASCDWEILLERIVSLVHQRILAIRRSYQSLLTPWSTVVIRSSYQSSLTPRSKNISSCYWKLI